MKHRNAAVVCTIVLLAASCATAPQPLMQSTPGPVSADVVLAPSTSMRSAIVTFDPREVARIRKGSVHELRLFPDVSLIVRTTSATSRERVVTWNATVEGAAKVVGAVMLAIGPNGAMGTIQVDQRLFSFRPRLNGGTVVYERDFKAFPPIDRMSDLPHRLPQEGQQPPVQAGPQDETVLSVKLVIPTPLNSFCSPFIAPVFAGAAEATLDKVWAPVKSIVTVNCIDHNPNTNLREELTWLELNGSALRGGSNFVSEVLYKSSDATAGLGDYNAPPVTAANANRAFSVVLLDILNDDYGLAHELGHNLGMQHDRANAQAGPGCNYGYVYSVGFFTFRTVMAYPCPDDGCPPTPLYSTPPLAGVACGQPNAANNRQQFDAAAPVAVGWQ